MLIIIDNFGRLPPTSWSLAKFAIDKVCVRRQTFAMLSKVGRRLWRRARALLDQSLTSRWGTEFHDRQESAGVGDVDNTPAPTPSPRWTLADVRQVRRRPPQKTPHPGGYFWGRKVPEKCRKVRKSDFFDFWAISWVKAQDFVENPKKSLFGRFRVEKGHFWGPKR